MSPIPTLCQDDDSAAPTLIITMTSLTWRFANSTT